MIKLIIIIAIIYFGYKAAQKKLSGLFGPDPSVSGKSKEQIDDVMLKDPVCGVYFPKKDGVPLKVGDEKLYFCSVECRNQYLESKKSK
jgi:hypothetical protein